MIRLTHRERWLITAITTIVAVWAFYIFGLRPEIESIKTLNRVIPENQAKLAELKAKSRQYLALAAAMENVKNNKVGGPDNFELVPFLESTCKDCGLAKKVVTMKQQVIAADSKYSEITADIQFENITLQQLVEFLLKTGSLNKPLWVKSLYVSQAKTDLSLIGVTLQISSFKPHPTLHP